MLSGRGRIFLMAIPIPSTGNHGFCIGDLGHSTQIAMVMVPGTGAVGIMAAADGRVELGQFDVIVMVVVAVKTAGAGGVGRVLLDVTAAAAATAVSRIPGHG